MLPRFLILNTVWLGPCAEPSSVLLEDGRCDSSHDYNFVVTGFVLSGAVRFVITLASYRLFAVLQPYLSAKAHAFVLPFFFWRRSAAWDRLVTPQRVLLA